MIYDVFGNKFSQDVFLQKYSLDGQEKWADTARRVVTAVCGQLLSKEEQEEIYDHILNRRFIPGGRYLYSAGKPFHQVNNCFLFRAEDSREGWADIMQRITASLMTGGGIGVEYSSLRSEGTIIKRTGGTSTGPLALMHMVNEAGRYIMQGGSRRSAIWAGLQWDHADIPKFLKLKDHSEGLRALKAADFNFALPMELTNISITYNTEFFIAMEDTNHPKHLLAQSVWAANCKQAFSTAEPGMSFNFRKDNENLRNACVTGDTEILTDKGYTQIQELVDNETNIWNGFEWSQVTPKITGTNEPVMTITFSDGRALTCTGYHDFHISKGYTGESEIIKAYKLQPGMKLIKHQFPVLEHKKELEAAYLQGFHSAEGMDGYSYLSVYEPKYICLDERLRGFGGRIKPEPLYKRTLFYHGRSLFPKTFVPFEYSVTSKLDWLSGLFDGDGCELSEGGMQLVSIDKLFISNVQKLLTTLGIQSKVIIGNLARQSMMPDGRGGSKSYKCKENYRICIGAIQMQELKALGLSCIRLQFNKKPQRDASQFVTVVSIVDSGIAEKVYCFNEPKKHLGIFNGIITGQCCEVVSDEDSDKCNLGTIWINRVKDVKELRKVTKAATLFLLCGGIYSDVPTPKIKEIGLKNNRIGLGLGGIHEWLMLKGYGYEVVPELHKWLSVYEQESDSASFIGAKQLGVSVPKGVRAIAPTGTLGIIAETTTGLEPLFCKAYKRRYVKEGQWVHQFVVDGAVKRLMEAKVPLEIIRDSYDIPFKQRVKFQADIQNYVDMSISSTCNMPAWGSEQNNETTLSSYSKTLLKYAKRLRGFTCYPDACRSGQPLSRVPLDEALAQEGQVFEDTEVECIGGVCGI